jgi:competence protein ComEA
VALGVIVGLVCVRLAFSSGSGALADGVVEEGLASEAEIVVEGLDSGADGGMPADGLGVEGAAGQDGAGSVIVHVAGAVARPGVYEVPGHARVHDAVMAAGGTLAEADLEAVNLAREVVDGERIYIPVPGQTPPPVLDGGGTNPVGDGTGGGDGAGLVDLNFADATALDSLPGIGPVLADRIVAYRDKNGPFPDLEALTDVPGIGPAILENVRDSVMVE